MTVAQVSRPPLEALAEAAVRAAAQPDPQAALALLADATREAADADLVVLRVRDSHGELAARAVSPAGSTLAAEVAASRAPASDFEGGALSGPTRRAAEHARAAGTLVEAFVLDERVAGAVELVRVASSFDEDERTVAQLVAAQLALIVRSTGGTTAPATADWLALAGEALAAGNDAGRAAHQATRIAVEATGAAAGRMWRVADGNADEIATTGDPQDRTRAAELALAAAHAWQPVTVDGDIATLRVGEPMFAALQLHFADGGAPPPEAFAGLAAFAARAAHALRAGEQAEQLSSELERTRALLEVVGEAVSRLSLSHTLETAVEHVAELLQIDMIGVYLIDHGHLSLAAGRGLRVGHQAVADRLLALALGPLRARTTLVVDTSASERAMHDARAALVRYGHTLVVGVPLQVGGEVIGLVVAYPPARRLAESEASLLAALGAQLAVAVQNARLHERATELGETLATVLNSERQSTRQLTALYEISHSFTQSLSLDTTLETITSTIVGVLGVDAAVIRMPDERGDTFVPRAVHVVESRLVEPVRTILERPQPRPPRAREPMLLDIPTALRLGGAHALLVPFLEKGSTAALLPISTPNEHLAQLTILSLDPAAPIDAETLATAGTIARQAALAIDNARLYQQQKQFAETMQQSLLPQEQPGIPGLEVGAMYESAARVDVGGDVFDFLELPDGRLAVVLGDVTGHGIDATGDMAMAKFVFRSLGRVHDDPAEFLARANDVVVSEIAPGKFITMTELVVDPSGAVRAASAGHPEPRIVSDEGTVVALCCGGMALGVEEDQTYEPVDAELPAGATVVLYTDGVVEARRGRELFGVERLDAVLADHRHDPPQELAAAVVAACRSFAGELADDCAVVAIRRTA
ncbi:MAG TPA: SpoIIE family protein phosphatase [Gaiellaceae bacterium]